MFTLIVALIIVIIGIWALRRGFRAIEHYQETRAAVKVHTVVRPRAAAHTRNRIRAETEGAHRAIDSRWGKLFDRAKARDERNTFRIQRRLAQGREVPQHLLGKRQTLQTMMDSITQTAREDHAAYERSSRSWRVDKSGELKPGVRRAGHNNEGAWPWQKD